MKRTLGNSLEFRAVKSCEDCAANCIGGFKKVASLYESGVIIYVHMHYGSDPCYKSLQGRESSRNVDNFIVHNTSTTEITKNAMVKELSNYKTKCFTCKGIIKCVRTLLEEVRTIRKNEIYAICDHCKRGGVKCKRCEYIIGKFKESKTEEREQLFRQWLSKVKQLLETISKGNICQYRLSQEASDAAELDKLLMELNSPMLAQRQLEIGAFPPIEFQENLAHSKDMLQELIQKLKYESGTKRYSSDDDLFMPVADTGCVCKYLMDRKTEQRRVLEPLTQQEAEPTVNNNKSLKKEAVFKEDKPKKGSSTTVGSVKQKSTKARKGSSTTERSDTVKSTKARKGSSTEKTSNTDKENKPAIEKKPKKPLHSEESNLLKKLINQRAKNKEKEEKQTKETKVKMPSFGELPKLRQLKKREVFEDFSESILECGDNIIKSPKEMIAGKNIVPFREHNEVPKTDSFQPLLFKLEAEFPSSMEETKEGPPSATKKINPADLGKKSVIPDRSGVIRYSLSDRQFIDKGWTQLPTTKIMRRMNVYKMLPVSSNDWFARHRHRGTMYYDSGQKLAVIQEDGQGKWFYKNGMVALDYYNAEEMFIQKRCVVYSYNACMKKPRNQTVLACFDYLGNGVVYDCRGNERLKYNQTEGQLIDEKIGPPGFWKWHSLNDPPVLQKVYIDTYYADRSAFEKPKTEDEHEKTNNNANDAMLSIEFENFVKEKAHKLLQTFKPFQIRMKTVKINDYFSLRVIDQANIYLLYRDGALTLKLNLGMLLQSKEIIDSDCAELSCVGTPYDRNPARSMSVHRLQGIILAARGKKKDCGYYTTTDNSM